jgi:hypothetical protein
VLSVQREVRCPERGCETWSLTEEHKLRAIESELLKNVSGPTKIRRTARNGGGYSIFRVITLTGLNRWYVGRAFEFLELHTSFR